MILGINDKLKFSDMKVRIGNLEDELAAYKKLLAEANDSVAAAEPSIDFNSMRVFSIERTVSNNKPCTVLGYYINDPIVSADGEMIVDRDKVKEWTLYCNNDRHATLVEEFKLWKQQSTRN